MSFTSRRVALCAYAISNYLLITATESLPKLCFLFPASDTTHVVSSGVLDLLSHLTAVSMPCYGALTSLELLGHLRS